MHMADYGMTASYVGSDPSIPDNKQQKGKKWKPLVNLNTVSSAEAAKGFYNTPSCFSHAHVHAQMGKHDSTFNKVDNNVDAEEADLILGAGHEHGKCRDQFSGLLSLLDKMEERSTQVLSLTQICGCIGNFARTMKKELPKHARAVASLNPDFDPQEYDPNPMPTNDTNDDAFFKSSPKRNDFQSIKLNEATLGKLGIAAQYKRKQQQDRALDYTAAESDEKIGIDPELIVKTLPLLVSTVYKLSRSLRLLRPDYIKGVGIERNPNAISRLMIYLGAAEMIPILSTNMKKIIPYLEEIELHQSKFEANFPERVIDMDKKILVESLASVLNEINNDDLFHGFQSEREWEAVSPIIESLLLHIQNGDEYALKPKDVLNEMLPDLQRLVSAVANMVDINIAEIKETEFVLGEFEFHDDFGDSFTAQWEKADGSFADDKIFAKQVSFRNQLSALSRRELQIEVNMLRKLNDPCLATFYGTVIFRSELYLVWDFYDHTLFKALFNDETRESLNQMGFVLSNEKAMEFAFDILSALEYMHHKGVLHQDLTTKNVLIKNDLSGVCLGDFCFVDQKREIRKSSTDYDMDEKLDFGIRYRAPETLYLTDSSKGNLHVFESDVYSFGVILFELIEKRLAYENLTYRAFKAKILSPPYKRPNFSERSLHEVPRFLQEMVNRCWQHKPELRPTVSTLLEEVTFQRSGQKLRSYDANGVPVPDGKIRSKSFLKWLPKTTDGSLD